MMNTKELIEDLEDYRDTGLTVLSPIVINEIIKRLKDYDTMVKIFEAMGAKNNED